MESHASKVIDGRKDGVKISTRYLDRQTDGWTDGWTARQMGGKYLVWKII